MEDVSQLEIHLANLRYVYDSHEFYVDDRKIQVRPQSASLLLLFLKAPYYTVSKEEIISCLWRQGIVTREIGYVVHCLIYGHSFGRIL